MQCNLISSLLKTLLLSCSFLVAKVAELPQCTKLRGQHFYPVCEKICCLLLWSITSHVRRGKVESCEFNALSGLSNTGLCSQPQLTTCSLVQVTVYLWCKEMIWGGILPSIKRLWASLSPSLLFLVWGGCKVSIQHLWLNLCFLLSSNFLQRCPTSML